MLLLFENGIRGGICTAIHKYAKANNKYIKNYDSTMLLLFENGIRGGICTAIHKFAKANNKYIKNYDSTKQSMYLMYLDANNLYGYAMSKKLPVDNFKWETNLTIFTEDFIKITMKKVILDIY